MTLEPAVVLGFVGIKVIEDDVDGGVGMRGDDIIHEVEELDAPPALLVRGRYLAGGYFEGGEQRRGTVALVIVAMSGQRSTVRELQVSLRPLQRLDRGLFVDADDDSVLGWRHVKPDHVGSLGDELGIVALAPGFAPGKVDLPRTQEAPDMLDIDITQCGSQQRPGPAGIAVGRPLIQQRQDAFVRLRRILRLGAPIARLVETRTPLLGIANPPLRDRAGRASNCTSNCPARHAVRSQKHDPSPLPQTVLRPRRARQTIKIGAFLHRQNDRCRFRDAAHASLNHDSFISDSRY